MITYLASKVSDLDILKAMKLLYFIDKHHLIRHGRPITGDTYYKLPYGPVPTLSYDLLKEAFDQSPIPDTEFPDRENLRNAIDIDRTTRYLIYKAKRDPNLNVFSETELASVEEIVSKFGQKSGLWLMNLSHRDCTFAKTLLNSQIDFYLFFEDEPHASREAMELMELEQDDRDFVEGMQI